MCIVFFECIEVNISGEGRETFQDFLGLFFRSHFSSKIEVCLSRNILIATILVVGQVD